MRINHANLMIYAHCVLIIIIYLRATWIIDKKINKMAGEKIAETVLIDHFYFNNSILIGDKSMKKELSKFNNRYPHETTIENPVVTIFFVSCGRSCYLYQTVQRVLDHIMMYERDLAYELSWIDQTTTNKSDIQNRFRFNKRIFYDKGIGIEKAIYSAFRNCDTKYILLMEEDWFLKQEVNFPFITESIEIMESIHPNIYGVLLREEYIITDTIKNLTIKNKKLNKEFHGFTHDVWKFMYTNGATLYKMSMIRKFIKLKGAGTELALSKAAKILNQRYFVHYWNEKYHFTNCVGPTIYCSQIFRHIGAKTTQGQLFSQCSYGRSFD